MRLPVSFNLKIFGWGKTDTVFVPVSSVEDKWLPRSTPFFAQYFYTQVGIRLQNLVESGALSYLDCDAIVADRKSIDPAASGTQSNYFARRGDLDEFSRKSGNEFFLLYMYANGTQAREFRLTTANVQLEAQCVEAVAKKITPRTARSVRRRLLS